MLSSIGQSIALVTFGQRYLEGRPAHLDWKQNGWFAYTEEIRFGIGGLKGPTVALDPNDWFEHLRAQGFRKLALFADRDGRDSSLAPLAIADNGYEVIWAAKNRCDPVTRLWLLYRGGFKRGPEDERLWTTKEKAVSEMRTALADLIRFQEAYRPDEAAFRSMFLLGGYFLEEARPEGPEADEIRTRVDFLFPPDSDPRSIALVSAVAASWALGGMGWWSDWRPSDPAIQAAFAQITNRYRLAMIQALVAACEPD